jgi:hypothetical protein
MIAAIPIGPVRPWAERAFDLAGDGASGWTTSDGDEREAHAIGDRRLTCGDSSDTSPIRHVLRRIGTLTANGCPFW